MSTSSHTSYVVVTPARDEAANMGRAIASMLAQTVRPAEWIIVNDGSTDDTGRIIDEAAAAHPWIRAVHRPRRETRQSGGGVIEAFLDGYKALAVRDWEFISKLDGDLSYDAEYFAKCFAHFKAEPRLGLGGGVVANDLGSRKHLEGRGDPSFHVRGATKIYRRACWEAIGGLVPMTGWDTIDEMKANMLGWQTRPFRDLVTIQHRVTGGADGSWKNSVKNGRANFNTGYHPLFMFLKCLKRIPRRPVLLDAAGLARGYFGSWLAGASPVHDPALVAFVRNQQIRRLTFRPSIYDR